jgi:hypothetical protein
VDSDKPGSAACADLEDVDAGYERGTGIHFSFCLPCCFAVVLR